MSDQTQPEPTQEIAETDSESEYETERDLEIELDGSQPPEFSDDEEIMYTSDIEEEPMMEYDMGGLLGSVLTTEDGDTVCSALVSISKQLEMQNRIMVKILAQLQKST